MRADLAPWMRAQIPDLLDEVYTTLTERIRLYRDAQIVPADDLRSSISDHAHAFLAIVTDPDTDPDPSTARAIGIRRAHQGLPLSDVLREVHIALSRLWEGLLARALQEKCDIETATMLSATSRIWQLIDARSVAVAEAYRAASAEVSGTFGEQRAAMVEAVMSGCTAPGADPVRAAAILGLPPDAEYVVVVADIGGAAEGGAPPFEAALAAKGVVSAWRSTPALLEGVVAVRPGDHEVALEILREVATGPTGVSPSYRSLTDSPRSLELSRAAMAALGPDRAEVNEFEASPLNALLARAPGEATRLMREVFGRLTALPDDDREMLLETLSAYFAHGGSAEAAAKALHCHANTVRYRLRRLHELTGRTLTSPQSIAEVIMAMYAMRMNPRWSASEE
ncbi:PucR family transcriptional regulator [Mycolicibacterium phlei]|nr:PucR family transcriptional regulator [Mycolicibacterium phlei]